MWRSYAQAGISIVSWHLVPGSGGSLVLNTAVRSGLNPSVAEDLRDENFPYNS
jgi:hypothetical protein